MIKHRVIINLKTLFNDIGTEAGKFEYINICFNIPAGFIGGYGWNYGYNYGVGL